MLSPTDFEQLSPASLYSLCLEPVVSSLVVCFSCSSALKYLLSFLNQECLSVFRERFSQWFLPAYSAIRNPGITDSFKESTSGGSCPMPLSQMLQLHCYCYLDRWLGLARTVSAVPKAHLSSSRSSQQRVEIFVQKKDSVVLILQELMGFIA